MDPYTSLEIGCTVTTIDNTGTGHVFSSRGEYNIKANNTFLKRPGVFSSPLHSIHLTLDQQHFLMIFLCLMHSVIRIIFLHFAQRMLEIFCSRAVTQTSSYKVYAIGKQGIELLGSSFGSKKTGIMLIIAWENYWSVMFTDSLTSDFKITPCDCGIFQGLPIIS